MTDDFPTTKSKWRQAAKGNGIGFTKPLADGIAFVSGSKFQNEHFLRLRVLYLMGKPLEQIHKHSGFDRSHLEKMQGILENDAAAVFLKGFLRKGGELERNWDVESARSSGIFAIAMEHLHLIAGRVPRDMGENEDKTDDDIVLTRNMTQSGAHHRSLSNSTIPFSTPPRRPPKNYYESPASDFDVSALTISTPGQEFAQIGDEIRREENKFQRSNFAPGDEQTVNAALVALIIALSWLLDLTGRVRHDRESFSIPTKDGETDLFKAAVDGLILQLGNDKCNGFMEVKRDHRGENKAVRRQIAAQMAAFIYQQDVVLTAKETEKAIEKATEKATISKGKKAEAKKDPTKHKVGGNQKEEEKRPDSEIQSHMSVNKFSKWIVSLDGYWAYINVATYDRQYLDFLSGDEPSSANDAFMEMREHGPFDLRKWSGQDGLGTFLKYVGAFMLGALHA